jgi:hypothetical protein
VQAAVAVVEEGADAGHADGDDGEVDFEDGPGA